MRLEKAEPCFNAALYVPNVRGELLKVGHINYLPQAYVNHPIYDAENSHTMCGKHFNLTSIFSV